MSRQKSIDTPETLWTCPACCGYKHRCDVRAQDLSYLSVGVYPHGGPYGKLRDISCNRRVQGDGLSKEVAMEVAIHLPDDVAAAVPCEDVPRHLVDNIALEVY